MTVGELIFALEACAKREAPVSLTIFQNVPGHTVVDSGTDYLFVYADDDGTVSIQNAEWDDGAS